MVIESAPRFLTLKEVAEMLRVEESAVQQLLEDGRIPAYEWGSTWTIPIGPLQVFLDEELKRQTASRRARESQDPSATESRSVADYVESPAPSSVVAGRHTREVAFVFRGRSFRSPNSIRVLERVLNELASTDVSFLERFSKEGSRKRRYIAREKSLLYAGRPDLGERFSKPIANGWWLGTNYNRDDINKILKKACEVADLQFGRDLIVDIHPKPNRLRALEIIGLASDPKSDVAKRHDEYFVRTLEDERS